jgi:phosphoribosylanthranilate isomerase
VQVIHVQNISAIDEAKNVESFVEYILLDSGNPNLDIKELGGTGRTHNWEISREIVKASNKPVFLAGGLSPANVKEAIRFVKPFGVDICSGVRTNGQLDPAKLSAFFDQI